MRHQTRVKGGRQALPACVLKEIRQAVQEVSIEYQVSRSWVVSTLLAVSLGIKEQPHFDDRPRRKRGRK